MNLSKVSRLSKLPKNVVLAVQYRRVIFRNISRAASAPDEEIKIPTRIERSPTDILEALAGTVKKDYTAPHYRYIDDPWLIPYSSFDQLEFKFAKENGKNAARFIFENHPDLFTKNRIEVEPAISAFQPRARYNVSNVTIELLDNLVSNFQVEDAKAVYDLLKQKKKTVPDELLLNLLQLLAYHTEEEPLTEENRDLKWRMEARQWEAQGLAESLYSQLANSGARLAMLLGLARNEQPVRAMQIWKEMSANKDPVPLEGFNAYISVLEMESASAVEAELKSVLKQMRDLGLRPNQETLISCLNAIDTSLNKDTANHKDYSKLALSVMSELKAVGVEPGLGAYYLLLSVFDIKAKVRSERTTTILHDILDLVEDRDMWPACSHQDFLFFLKASRVAFSLKDSKLALRLHEFLLTGNNLNLLGNNVDAGSYHSNLITTLLMQKELDTAMRLYNQLVPHSWTPTIKLYKFLVQEIRNTGAVNHIGKVYDDMELMFQSSKKEEIYELHSDILKTLIMHPSAFSMYNDLSATYVDLAERIFDHLVTNKDNKKLYLRHNSRAEKICSMSMKVLLLENKYEVAVKIFEFCNEERGRMPGALDLEPLTNLMLAVVAEKDIDVGIRIVDYLLAIGSNSAARDCGLKLSKLALTSNNRRTLNAYLKLDPLWVEI